MKIVLCGGNPTAARLAAALELAHAAPDPAALAVLPRDASPDPAAAPAAAPTVRLGECYSRDGAFHPIRLVARLDALMAGGAPAALVLDSNAGPLATIDGQGNRTGEIAYHFMRRFFWEGPRPAVTVHFVPAHLLMYFARDWARIVVYPPQESTRSATHDDSEQRVARMIGEMDGLRSKYHPWDKFKRKVRERLRSWAFWRP